MGASPAHLERCLPSLALSCPQRLGCYSHVSKWPCLPQPPPIGLGEDADPGKALPEARSGQAVSPGSLG